MEECVTPGKSVVANFVAKKKLKKVVMVKTVVLMVALRKSRKNLYFLFKKIQIQ
jgi:hypothetical protein